MLSNKVGSVRPEGRERGKQTLVDLLSTVDLGELLLDELVTLLADGDNLLARLDELGNRSQDLLRDLSGGLVLGESIGVVEGVVCGIVSYLLQIHGEGAARVILESR